MKSWLLPTCYDKGAGNWVSVLTLHRQRYLPRCLLACFLALPTNHRPRWAFPSIIQVWISTTCPSLFQGGSPLSLQVHQSLFHHVKLHRDGVWDSVVFPQAIIHCVWCYYCYSTAVFRCWEWELWRLGADAAPAPHPCLLHKAEPENGKKDDRTQRAHWSEAQDRYTSKSEWVHRTGPQMFTPWGLERWLTG